MEAGKGRGCWHTKPCDGVFQETLGLLMLQVVAQAFPGRKMNPAKTRYRYCCGSKNCTVMYPHIHPIEICPCVYMCACIHDYAD